MSPRAARHNGRHENILTMDPPQLAEYAISRTPGSWMVAGILLRHNISGQTLAESPEELVDGVTEGLGPQIREEVQRLYVEVRTSSRAESRRSRSLLNIIEELECFSPELDFGGAAQPPSHEQDEPPFWDFFEGDDGSLTTSEPDIATTQASSIFSKPRDMDAASETSIDVPGGGDRGQGEQTKSAATDDDSQNHNDSRRNHDDDEKQPRTTDLRSTSSDGDRQSFFERIAAEDAALLVLTGREILAVSSALQFRSADLNATIIPPPTNLPLNQPHSEPMYRHAERRTTGVVLTADIRASSRITAEIRAKSGEGSRSPDHGVPGQFPSSDHPAGNSTIPPDSTSRHVSVKLSLVVDS